MRFGPARRRRRDFGRSDRRAQAVCRHFEESVVRWDSDNAFGSLVSHCARPIESVPAVATVAILVSDPLLAGSSAIHGCLAGFFFVQL